MKSRRALAQAPRTDPFARTRVELERWRCWRRSGERIPSRLWSSAVDLAREHGVSRTSSALRIDYYALKGRLAELGKSSLPVTRRSRADPDLRRRVASEGGFVEVFPLSLPNPSVTSVADCAIVVEDAHGTRLRVELRGAAASSAGVEALARSLWSGATAPPRSRS
jgi:hypothetical protein